VPINENHVEVAKYRGPVRPCEHCKNATLPGPLQTFCKFCFTRGYIAQCLKCDGSGTVKAVDPWGSNSLVGSTCDICGGTGTLPANKPEDAEQPQQAMQQPQGISPQPQQASQTGHNVQDSNVQPPIKQENTAEKEVVTA